MFISRNAMIITGIIIALIVIVGGGIALVVNQQANSKVVNIPASSSSIPTASTISNYTSSAAYSSPVPTSLAATSSTAAVSSASATSVSTSSATTTSTTTVSSESSKPPVRNGENAFISQFLANASFSLPNNWISFDGVSTIENNAGVSKVANGFVFRNTNNESRLNVTFGIYDGDKGPNTNTLKNRWLSDNDYYVLKNDWARVKMKDPVSKKDIYAYVPAKNIILKEKKEFDKEKTKCDDIRNGKLEGDLAGQCADYRSASALVDANSFQYIATSVKEKLLVDPKGTIINDKAYNRFFEDKSLSFIATITFTGKNVDEADTIMETISIDLK
jgi:hypothetical protein